MTRPPHRGFYRVHSQIQSQEDEKHRYHLTPAVRSQKELPDTLNRQSLPLTNTEAFPLPEHHQMAALTTYHLVNFKRNKCFCMQEPRWQIGNSCTGTGCCPWPAGPNLSSSAKAHLTQHIPSLPAPQTCFGYLWETMWLCYLTVFWALPFLKSMNAQDNNNHTHIAPTLWPMSSKCIWDSKKVKAAKIQAASPPEAKLPK